MPDPSILPPSLPPCTFQAFRHVVHLLPMFGPGGKGIVSQGHKQTHLVEIRTVLPSGRPAVMQFNVGERYLLVRALVPRLWSVPPQGLSRG